MLATSEMLKQGLHHRRRALIDKWQLSPSVGHSRSCLTLPVI